MILYGLGKRITPEGRIPNKLIVPKPSNDILDILGWVSFALGIFSGGLSLLGNVVKGVVQVAKIIAQVSSYVDRAVTASSIVRDVVKGDYKELGFIVGSQLLGKGIEFGTNIRLEGINTRLKILHEDFAYKFWEEFHILGSNKLDISSYFLDLKYGKLITSLESSRKLTYRSKRLLQLARSLGEALLVIATGKGNPFNLSFLYAQIRVEIEEYFRLEHEITKDLVNQQIQAQQRQKKLEAEIANSFDKETLTELNQRANDYQKIANKLENDKDIATARQIEKYSLEPLESKVWSGYRQWQDDDGTYGIQLYYKPSLSGQIRPPVTLNKLNEVELKNLKSSYGYYMKNFMVCAPGRSTANLDTKKRIMIQLSLPFVDKIFSAKQVLNPLTNQLENIIPLPGLSGKQTMLLNLIENNKGLRKKYANFGPSQLADRIREQRHRISLIGAGRYIERKVEQIKKLNKRGVNSFIQTEAMKALKNRAWQQVHKTPVIGRAARATRLLTRGKLSHKLKLW